MTSPAEIEAIATKAAEKALAGFFTRLGIDASDPLATQRDFAWLRTRVNLEERISGRAVVILVSGFVVGLLSIVGLGLKALLTSLYPH